MPDSDNATSVNVSKVIKLRDEFGFGSKEENTQQTILSFLEKPYLLSSGTFQASDNALTFTGYDMPSTVLALDYYSSKLKGNAYFVADMEFTLTVNANPFQQGRYFLAFVPFGGTPGTAAWVEAHIFSVMQRTQVPHAEIDLSTQSKTVLTVPFNIAYSSFSTSTTSKLYDAGHLKILPYSSLATGSGGTATCGYSLWFRFVNIRLSTAALPHAGPGFDNNTKTEQKSQNAGPLESASNFVGSVSKVLTQIPVLSPYAGMVSWAADIVSGVAAKFGWARPTNLGKSEFVQQDIMYNICNYDGLDNSKVLAYSCKNEIEKVSGFAATDVDELDFSTFLSLPSYSGYYFDWTDNQASGVNLLSFDVTPYSFTLGVVDAHGNTTYNFAPVAFMSTQFSLWRGGFQFRFKLVKTRYHSGRLSICYNPRNDTATPAVPDITTAAYLNRHIIDIADVSEFTLKVPYTANAPYLRNSGSNSVMGSIHIFVQDELVRPSTASSSITCLIEVSCLPDFEFAVPRTNPYISVLNTSVAIAPHAGQGFEPQYLGAFEEQSPTLAPARACVGERITSLRQMLKIPQLLVTRSDAIVSLPYLNVWPFAIACAWSRTGGIDLPYWGADLYSSVAMMFTLSRGSVRYKLFPAWDEVITALPALAWLTPINDLSYNNDFIVTSSGDVEGSTLLNNYAISGGPLAISKTDFRGGMEIQVPQYSRMHSRANSDLTCSSTHKNVEGRYTTPQNVLTVYRAATGGLTLFGGNIARSLGDDGNMGGFISIPPMTVYPPS